MKNFQFYYLGLFYSLQTYSLENLVLLFHPCHVVLGFINLFAIVFILRTRGDVGGGGIGFVVVHIINPNPNFNLSYMTVLIQYMTSLFTELIDV